MPFKKAEAIQLSEKQASILVSYEKSTQERLHLKERASIILRASRGESNHKISVEMNITPKTVSRWRTRYLKAFERLQEIEKQKPRLLKQTIVDVLSDEARPGAPARITDVQKAAIIALACENPEKRGLPFSKWSGRLLREEAIKRGIVESISDRHINSFLKSSGIKATSSEIMVESKD